MRNKSKLLAPLGMAQNQKNNQSRKTWGICYPYIFSLLFLESHPAMLTHGSSLRRHSWQGSRDPMLYWRLDPGPSCARQLPFTILSLQHPSVCFWCGFGYLSSIRCLICVHTYVTQCVISTVIVKSVVCTIWDKISPFVRSLSVMSKWTYFFCLGPYTMMLMAYLWQAWEP